MKLLIINNSSLISRGGRIYVHKSTGEFGKELRDLGNQVEYFQILTNDDTLISSFDLQENKIKVSFSKIYKLRILTYMIGYLKGMRRIIKNEFIYFYYPNNFFILALFAKILGKKYGLYIRGEVGIDSKKTKLLCKYADIILTVTDLFTEKVNKLNSDTKVSTIRPMISFGTESLSRNRIYNNSLNKVKILYLGRIDEQKGLFELLHAFKKVILNNNEKSFNLNIVGDGPYIFQLKQLAIQLDINNFVQFHGAIMDSQKIREKYLEADIFILPSYHEGFPRTLYEAMIFGTPIITTFVGGISALMVHEYNCIKIETKSIESIQNKIEYLINNYEITSVMCENGFNIIENILRTRKLSHAELLTKMLYDL